jgi:hypothetical protein
MIRQRRIAGLVLWLGETNGTPPWSCGPETDPAKDFEQGVLQMAGVVSELMFEGDDFRAGSSLDEVAITNGLASTVAVKTGADGEDVMMSIIAAAGTILERNKEVVETIARWLELHRSASGSRLARMLSGVMRVRA